MQTYEALHIHLTSGKSSFTKVSGLVSSLHKVDFNPGNPPINQSVKTGLYGNMLKTCRENTHASPQLLILAEKLTLVCHGD